MAKFAHVQIVRIKSRVGQLRGFHNSSFDPQTLVLLEAAFDEAWLTLKSVGNKTVKPDELARAVVHLAIERERDPVRLHDEALNGLLPWPRRNNRGPVATPAGHFVATYAP